MTGDSPHRRFCTSATRSSNSEAIGQAKTVDAVHGHQKLPEWNAHYDARCFLPSTSKPALGLDPGDTAAGHRRARSERFPAPRLRGGGDRGDRPFIVMGWMTPAPGVEAPHQMSGETRAKGAIHDKDYHDRS